MYSTPQATNIPYIPENPFSIPPTASPCPSTATSSSPATAVSSTTSTPPAWLPQLTPMPAVSSTSKSEKKSKSNSPTHKSVSSSPSKSTKLHRCHHQDCKYETDRRSNLNRHIVAMHERKIARSSHFCCGLHFENKAKQRLVV